MTIQRWGEGDYDCPFERCDAGQWVEYDDHAEEVARLQAMVSTLEVNAATGLVVMMQFGSIDGAHHKQWVLDQVARALTGKNYSAWVKEYNFGDDYNDWDCGVAP